MNGQHKDIDIVIYGDGFRPNVGIVICNQFGQVLWARRIGQNSWQFPQGGIKSGESPVQAMYRELNEELGLLKADVKIMMISKMWHKYQLPQRLVRWNENPVCLGQRQKWFLLKLSNDAEKKIQFNLSNAPEFDNWRWVSYWYPVRQVISFKRDVYRKVLKEFSHCALFDFGKSSDSFKSSNSRGTVKKNNKNFYQLGIRR
jgi:putative (di)nucleoside polyphosphate hydrolase